MRWRLVLGLGVVVAASLAAVVIAIGSAGGPDDLDRIKSALRLQTNCSSLAVRRPSDAPVVRRWTGLSRRSADVLCPAAGVQIVYAQFAGSDSLDRALFASPPPSGYCRLSDAIVINPRGRGASTLMSDVCQDLGGTAVITPTP